MKVLHTSDWHLGKTLEGFQRLDEQKQFLDDLVKIVEEKEIDLILHAGDVYDTINPPAAAETLFYETMKRLSKSGERAIVIIAGNHDNPDRLEAVMPLSREHGILIFGTPNSVMEVGRYGQFEVVDSGKGFVELDIRGERTVILTVPYPSEKRLGVLFDGEGEEEVQKTYSEKLGDLFTQLQRHFREDTINLAMSHLYVVGGEVTDSERAIQLGGTYSVELNHLPLQAQYIALGHLHKTQDYTRENKPIIYSGSPIQYSKKERNNRNSVYIFDAEPGKEIKPERIYLNNFKPIELWTCENVQEAIEMCREHCDDNTWVYLEILTERIITQDEIKEMKRLKRDIIEIRPILGDSEREEEEIENIADFNIEDIFTRFYMEKSGVTPDSELVELFLSLSQEEEE